VWDEAPFEFDEAVKKEFASLPELPVVRKKGKAEKFVFPVSKPNTESKSKTDSKVKKEKTPPPRTVKVVEEDIKQPKYKLKHTIQFY
jgi:hypothetical protein